MSTPNDGGPAFPVREADRYNAENNETHVIEQHYGMSLRDWFAGQALNGLLSDHNMTGKPEEFADYAYRHADAMLKERAK